MLPKKENNIYPKSDENVKALVSFYFDKFDIDQSEIIEKINQKTSLELNQLEFIIKQLADAYEPVFKTNLKGVIKLTNLFQYGIDALANNTSTIDGSIGRIRITNEFRQFIENKN